MSVQRTKIGGQDSAVKTDFAPSASIPVSNVQEAIDYLLNSLLPGSYQPLDSDLTAIAALSTTAYGRALLELANAAAARTALELGTAAVEDTGFFATAAQGALADSALQNVVEDTTPQLGGDLDLNGNDITGTGNIETTGHITLGGGDTTHTIAGVPVVSQIELHSDDLADLGGLTVHRHTDFNDFGSHAIFLRSNGTHAAPTVPGDGDVISRIVGGIYDGTDYELASEIRHVVDGMPGNNAAPGAIDFYTNPGTQTPLRRMRIRADGKIEVISFIGVGAVPTVPADIRGTSGNTVIRALVTGSTGGGAEIKASNGYSLTVPVYAFWFNSNTGIGNPEANVISDIINGTEQGRMIAGGYILRGLTSRLTTGDFQYLSDQNAGGSSTVGGNLGLLQYSDDNSSSFLMFYKSRSGTKGTGTVVQYNDDVGEVSFHGDGGSGPVKGAIINASVDSATITTTVVPTRIMFWTQPVGGVLTERMRINANGSIAMGTNPSADASAVLDLQSTTKGFAQPRMTTTQRDAISSPATALQVFNTTLGLPQYYDGAAWRAIGDSIMLMCTSDVTIQSDDTNSDDPVMTFAMLANTDYWIEGELRFNSGATPDFKYAFTGPASPTLVEIAQIARAGGATSIAVNRTDTSYTGSSLDGAGGGGIIYFSGLIKNGANAGSFAVQWAQNTSAASDTIRRMGSFLRYRRIT